MSQLVHEVQDQIALINNQAIAHLLIPNLSPDATKIQELFCLVLPPDRNDSEELFPDSSRIPCKTALSTAYACAPEILCRKLTDLILQASQQEQLNLLNATSLHDKTPEQVFKALLLHAPFRDRQRISATIKTWGSTNIDTLLDTLLRSDSGASQFDEFLALLRNNEDEASMLNLIYAMGKTDKTRLLTRLQSSSFPASFNTAVRFFQTGPGEKTALAFLALIESLDNKSLRELFFGDSDRLFSNNCENLLHAALVHPSEKVVQQIFTLFKRLDKTDQNSLMSCRARVLQETSDSGDQYDFLTPLELLFTRKEYLGITPLVVKELGALPELLALLSKVTWQHPESPLHSAARLHNTQALTIYLQQQDTTLNHPAWSGKQSILDLATTAGFSDIATLEKASTLYHLLRKKTISSRELRTCKKLLASHPQVLDTVFEGGNTLLHRAVKLQRPAMVKLFLDYGANAHSKNTHQKTPLDYAIQTRQEECFRALALKPDENGCFPITTVLNDDYYAVLVSMITEITRLKPRIADLSFIQGLNALPAFKTHQDALAKTFATYQKGTVEVLYTHCKMLQDTSTFFLLETAKRLADQPSPELLQAAQGFMIRHLTVLADKSGVQDKETARLQLIIFLFSMPVKSMTAFIRKCSLHSSLKNELDLLLSYGLIQTLIFSNLSDEEYRLLLKTLSRDARTSVASIHFCQSDLTQFSPVLLQDLANSMTTRLLYQHSQKSQDPGLLILTLQELLIQTPEEKETIAVLMEKLRHELALFNRKPCPLPQKTLQHLLNLATYKEVKEIIADFLDPLPENAPIRQTINNLFTTFQAGQALPENSFLRAEFIKIASQPDTILQKTRLKAFTALLALTTESETKLILATFQHSLQPALTIHSLMQATHTSPHLAHWLAGLEVKLDKLPLHEFIDKLKEAQNQLIQFASQMSAEQENPVNALLMNMNTLELILESALAGNDILNWIDDLYATCDDLQAAYSELEKHSATDNPEQELPALQNTLKLPGQHLPAEIRTLCTSLAAREELFVKTLANTLQGHKNLQALLPIISKTPLGNIPQGLAQARETQTGMTKKSFISLQSCLVSGLTENPCWPRLIEPFLAWHNQCIPSRTLKNQVLDHFPKWLQTAAQQAVNLAPLLQTNMQIRKDAGPALAALESLRLTQPSLTSLCNTLLSVDAKALQQLICLSEQAGRQDMAKLVQAVLLEKSGKLPLQVWIQKAPDEDISAWLDGALRDFESWCTHTLSLQVMQTGLKGRDEEAIRHLTDFTEFLEQEDAILSERAILSFINYWQSLLIQDNFSAESQAFVHAFSILMNKSVFLGQLSILSALSPEFLTSLMEHCLSGLGSSDATRAKSCQNLLGCLTQAGASDDTSNLELIKHQLGSQNLNILEDSHLIALANSILKSSQKTLESSTINGVWIQRLLTSPKFVAACTPEVLHHLTQRYRLLSLTLKQDEFEHLNAAIKNQLSFDKQHRQGIGKLEQTLQEQSGCKAFLLEKRQRLLQFRADDSVRALFNQLEDNCYQLEKTSPQICSRALDTLDTYYHKRLATLQNGIWFTITDYIHEQFTANQGDLGLVQSTLLTWVDSYIPHKNFEQKELTRKQQVFLYDEDGQEMGFINESLQAMTFLEDEPRPLISTPGIKAGKVLYDKHRHRLGILTKTGQVQRENLFQQFTSARLLARVPEEELLQSQAALNLLTHDMCNENALDTLYGCIEVSANNKKRAWLEQHIGEHLATSKKLLSAKLLEATVHHHSAESVMSILSNMKNKDNAQTLFSAILKHDSKRDVLFGKGQNAFNTWLNRFDAVAIFSDYLIQHYDKPWFAMGLQLFANYGKTHHKDQLLIEALMQAGQSGTDDNQCRALMQTFIATEETARVVLNDLLFDERSGTIQTAMNDQIKAFTSLFNKNDLIPVISALNQPGKGKHNARYRMLLFSFAAHHETLFKSQELRLSTTQAWSASDLLTITTFVQRHLKNIRSSDKESQIGHTLLNELTLRTANMGQTGLFYQEDGKTLDISIIRHSLKRSALEALVARFVLPDWLTSPFRNAFDNLCAFFNPDTVHDEKTIQALKDNDAFIDWKTLSTESWSQTNTTELPILCAWLMHYSGPAAAARSLLNDYFSSPALQSKPDEYHQITHLMATLPTRDVSMLVFHSLEKTVLEKPKLLDAVILKNMAYFYYQKHGNNKPASPAAEISLLRHFGQQKHYALVQTCCALLAGCGMGRLVDKIHTEARVESELMKHQNTWYFGLLKFFKRGWNYSNEPTKIIRFCDDNQVTHTQPANIPSQIKASVAGGQSITKQLEFLEKTRVVKKKFERFINPEKPASDKDKTTVSDMGLFKVKNDRNLLPESSVLVAERGV